MPLPVNHVARNSYLGFSAQLNEAKRIANKQIKKLFLIVVSKKDYFVLQA
jgi:hypothetical protein